MATAHRQPCSNDQAEKFVRTLKSDIGPITATTFDEPERVADELLLQYRNVKHSVRKENPLTILNEGILHTNMMHLEFAEVKYYRANDL